MRLVPSLSWKVSVCVYTGAAGKAAKDQYTCAPPVVLVIVMAAGDPLIVMTMVLVFTDVSRLAISANVVSGLLDILDVVPACGDVIETIGRRIPGSATGTKTR